MKEVMRRGWFRDQGLLVRKASSMGLNAQFFLKPVVDNETGQLLATEPETNKKLIKKLASSSNQNQPEMREEVV
jgi:hypothetical protein